MPKRFSKITVYRTSIFKHDLHIKRLLNSKNINSTLINCDNAFANNLTVVGNTTVNNLTVQGTVTGIDIPTSFDNLTINNQDNSNDGLAVISNTGDSGNYISCTNQDSNVVFSIKKSDGSTNVNDTLNVNSQINIVSTGYINGGITLQGGDGTSEASVVSLTYNKMPTYPYNGSGSSSYTYGLGWTTGAFFFLSFGNVSGNVLITANSYTNIILLSPYVMQGSDSGYGVIPSVINAVLYTSVAPPSPVLMNINTSGGSLTIVLYNLSSSDIQFGDNDGIYVWVMNPTLND